MYNSKNFRTHEKRFLKFLDNKTFYDQSRHFSKTLLSNLKKKNVVYVFNFPDSENYDDQNLLILLKKRNLKKYISVENSTA